MKDALNFFPLYPQIMRDEELRVWMDDKSPLNMIINKLLVLVLLYTIHKCTHVVFNGFLCVHLKLDVCQLRVV